MSRWADDDIQGFDVAGRGRGSKGGWGAVEISTRGGAGIAGHGDGAPLVVKVRKARRLRAGVVARSCSRG